MSLPLEMIELVLSKSSVKPLLRFKSVCKSWNTIISDPIFVQNHHHRQRSKDSNSHNLFLCRNSMSSSEGFSLVKFEEGRKIIQTLQVIKGPYFVGKVLCFCEGLLLIADDFSRRSLLLWNPSARTHTSLQPQFYDTHAAFGLCRDPITDDFKVVVVDWYSYSVYSCNNKSWTKKEEIHETEYSHYLRENKNPSGVCVDGASYWVLSRHGVTKIMYYNPRDNKVNFLQKPGNVDDMKSIYLVDLRGSLCMYCCKERDETAVEIWRKEKGIDNYSWKEFVTIRNVETPIDRFEPQCFIGNNKIVIRIKVTNFDGKLVVYNLLEKRFEEFEDTMHVFFGGLVPYMDPFFFPVEK